MKKIYLAIVSVLVFAACGSSYEEPDSAIDAGRQFIAAIYNGNFKRAKQLVVPTAENEKILKEKFEKPFRGRNGFEKTALSKASIQIREIKLIDSTNTVIGFLNAYSTENATIEIKKIGGNWKVALDKIP